MIGPRNQPASSLNEGQARYILIDPALRDAGWNLEDRTQVGFEIPVDGYDAAPWNGVTDYCLYAPGGEVIAVVEAKRCSRNPREADEQLRHYVTEIAKRQSYAPFGFMTNGLQTWFWEVGQTNPRVVAGFFSPQDLQRLLFLRQNGRPLPSMAINTSIVDRPYQHEAIRRVAEAFAANKRRALLVMATGTGKTRATMALIDLFLRANQAQNVLFLADRDALVDQALTDGFKAHLPNEPRDRIYTWKIDTDKRLFVATEQTLSLCFQKFNPGFFDLIVFDEAHRSIFRRFTEVIEYFDARMVGLTATPANFIDRDTFRVFQCDSTTPTFLYEYQQAVKEGFLVDFSLYQARTGFQRKGIKGADLTEEDRNALIEQGLDPDAIDYAGTEIEIEVSNKDTLRRQWEEIMEVCLKDQSGQLPGKTIVFAMTKAHAHRIAEVFEEMYPQHVGVAQVITSTTERVRDGSYGDGLITKFKKNDLPRIAVSVDMLDRIPQDSFPVRKVWTEIEQAWQDGFWTLITPVKLDFLRLKVGPLLRFAADVDVAAETFTHKVERLKLQMQSRSPSPQLLQSIAEDVSLLPEIEQLVERYASAKLALSNALATAEPGQLTRLIADLAPLMKNRRNRPSAFLKIDLPDFIETRGYISVGEGGQQIHVEEYRRRVEARILQIVDTHPALAAIREGREVSDELLVDLERTLHRELGEGDLHLSPKLIHIAFGLKTDNFLGFLRHVLTLDAIPDYPQVVQRAFEHHVAAHRYNADQIRFLRAVQELFLKQRHLVEGDLYEPPLTQFGRNAVDRYFSPGEVREILDLTERLAA